MSQYNFCHKCGFAVLFSSHSHAKCFPDEQLLLLLALLHFTHAKKNSFLCLGFGCPSFDTIHSFYALLKHAFLSFRLSYEKIKECVFREIIKMLFLLILVELHIHNVFWNHSYFPLRFASMEHSLRGWKIVATLN